MEGKCILNDHTVFIIGSLVGATCTLCFGRKTKFDYKQKNNMVRVSRKNIDLEIPKEDFIKKFTIQ